jgi:hypothetical protein
MPYDIGLPIQGQPISSGSFGVPVKNAIDDLDARMSIVESNLVLPSPVNAFGNGTNAVTAAAGVWQTLASANAVANITNPSDVYNLICLIFFGAWQLTTTGDVRMGINVTGGVVSDPEIGPNSPLGYGLTPQSTFTTSSQGMGMFKLVIPPNVAAVTLTAQGKRSAGSGGQNVNYPTIEIVPFRYELP